MQRIEIKQTRKITSNRHVTREMSTDVMGLRAARLIHHKDRCSVITTKNGHKRCNSKHEVCSTWKTVAIHGLVGVFACPCIPTYVRSDVIGVGRANAIPRAEDTSMKTLQHLMATQGFGLATNVQTSATNVETFGVHVPCTRQTVSPSHSERKEKPRLRVKVVANA